MKKLLALAILVVALTSCSTTKFVNYGEYSLTKVINTSDVDTELKISKGAYENENFMIELSMTKNSIDMYLKNKGKSSISIDWDKAAYIDQLGSALRIIHENVKFIDRDKEQIPSIIPYSSFLTDRICPADNIYWNKTLNSWEFLPLSYLAKFKTEDEALGAKTSYQPIKLMLPIEIEDKTIEYIFQFDTGEITTKQVFEYDAKKTSQATWGISGGLLGLCIILPLLIL